LGKTAGAQAQPSTCELGQPEGNRTEGSNPSLSARKSAPWFQSSANACDGEIELLLDEAGFEPKHPVAEARELAVAARIRAGAAGVIPAVNFYDKPRAGATKSAMKRPSGT
jgi:hypothetical protein